MATPASGDGPAVVLDAPPLLLAADAGQLFPRSDGFVDDFSPYVMVRSLGSGAFGDTYLAYHPARPAIQVAVKLPRGSPDSVNASVVASRLRVEARIFQSLSHPHIVTFLEFVEKPGLRDLIVMSYVDGGSLAQRLEVPGSRLTAPAAARLLREILMALDYMHSKGVVHLDLT